MLLLPPKIAYGNMIMRFILNVGSEAFFSGL
jgi:hypothetical protein